MDKIEYEKRIVDHMISLYCCKNHRSPFSLCPECNLLKDYAFDRLTHCPFKEHKGGLQGVYGTMLPKG